MTKKKYILGRNIVLYVTLAEFVITVLHGYDYQLGFDFLLLGNLLSHAIAPLFFVGIIFIFYGLIVRREYVDYKLSIWDLIAIFFLLMTTHEYWYTIFTPHPLFYEQYGI